MLTHIDFIVIAFYILAIVGIGLWASRKATPEGFLISERRMGLLSSIATINATKTGAILLAYTAILYVYGVAALWVFIGAVLGYIVFIPFAKKLHIQSNGTYYTLADYFHHHYGKWTGYFASAINIIAMVGYMVINLVAAAKVLEFFTPLSFNVSAIGIAGVILIYLMLSGFNAVVKTDILQYIAIIFILLFFAFFLSQGVSIPQADLTIFSAGIGDIIGFLLIGVLLPFASPDLWQRVYAMPKRIVSKSIFWSVLIYFFVSVVLTYVGLLVKTQLPTIDPDSALIFAFSNLLPVGLTGLAIVIFFAAFMSSIDTYSYTAASSLIQNHFRSLSKVQTISWIRRSLLGIVTLGALLAILFSSIVDITFIFTTTLILLAVPALATWIHPHIQATTLNTSFIVGGSSTIVFIILDILQHNLNPTIIPKAIVGGLVGLAIGALYSWIRKIRKQ